MKKEKYFKNPIRLIIKSLAIIFLTLDSLNLHSQIQLSDDTKLKIGGFVRNDAFYDTRLNEEAIEGLFLMYPKNILKDSKGNDQNAVPNASLLALTTRLNFAFSGSDVCGAKGMSFVEFDFTGLNTTMGVRLRHAYQKLNWEKSELIIGQTWHPLFLAEMFPTTVAFNAGGPFIAFNRSPQVRYTQNFGKLSSFIAISYLTGGGAVGPTTYNQRYAILPEINLSIQYQNENILLGARGGVKNYRPLLVNTSKDGKLHTVNDRVWSKTILAFAQYKTGLLKIKASSMLGENMHDMLMLGGYAVTGIDSTTGSQAYSPFQHSYNWVNVVYGDKIMFSMVMGYAKNMGITEKKIADVKKIYGRATDIDQLMRIAPGITYKTGKMSFGFECDITIANYGTLDENDYGKVKDSQSVTGIRGLFTSVYNF